MLFRSKNDIVKNRIIINIVRDWRDDVEKVELYTEKENWTNEIIEQLRVLENSVHDNSFGDGEPIEFVTAGNGYAYLELRDHTVIMGEKIDFNEEYTFKVH